jgi:hypothetical protein
MSKKKKKSTPYQAVSSIPFVGNIPIVADGTAIKQPIILEESDKVQQVSITNSIPPLDITIKQIDFTSAAQMSSVDVNLAGQIANVAVDVSAQTQNPIYVSDKIQTLGTNLSSGLVSTAGETATSSTVLATINIGADYRAYFLSAGVNITVGTSTYYRLEIRIKNAAAADVMVFRCYVRNGSGEINIPLNGLLLLNGYTIDIHARRNVTGCTHEVNVNFAVIAV